MGDKQIKDVLFLLPPHQQLQDPFLNDLVQSRRDLVANDDIGIGRK